MIKLLIKVIMITLLVFGGFVLLSLIKDDRKLGLPFWFYKDDCQMTMNINTGEMGGITYVVSYLNLFWDCIISSAIELFMLFFYTKFSKA